MRHLNAALWMTLAALALAGPAAGKDTLVIGANELYWAGKPKLKMVIGLNLLGDGLRDVLDPRTRAV